MRTWLLSFLLSVSAFCLELPPSTLSSQEILQKVNYTKVPKWVRPIEYSDEVNVEKSLGIAYLILDRQTNLEEKEAYIRHAYKFLASREIEHASRISIYFNPYIEKVNIHEVSVIRKGKVLDKLKTAKVKLFHDDDSVYDLVYKDTQKLVLYLEDLRVGDIVRYSYTLKYHDEPLMYGWYSFQESVYYNKIAARVITRTDSPLYINTYGGVPEAEVCVIDNQYKEFLWEAAEVEPLEQSSCVPSWYMDSPVIEISTSNSWAEVARYEMESLTPEPQELSLEIRNLIRSWQARYPHKEDQILAALRFVSNELFYRCFHEGVSYRRAYHPNDVVRAGCGDCKDKTFLLITLLELLDVEAYPVLVHTRLQHQVKQFLPNMGADHIIVTLVYEGKPYFVDPVIAQSGGRLKTLTIPPYGYGLVLKEDTEGLTPIPRSELLAKHMTHKKFTVNHKDHSAQYQVTNIYANVLADEIRSGLEPGFEYQLLQTTLKSLQDWYGEVSILSPNKIEDRLEDNKIIDSYAFLIKNIAFKRDGLTYYDFKPSCYVDFNRVGVDRKAPLKVESEEVEEVIDIILDKPWQMAESIDSYEDENFSYVVQWQMLTDRQLRVRLAYKILNDWIAPDQVQKFIDKTNEFTDKSYVIIQMPY